MAARYTVTIGNNEIEVWETVTRIDGCSVRTFRSTSSEDLASRASEVNRVWLAGFLAGQEAQAEKIREALKL